MGFCNASAVVVFRTFLRDGRIYDQTCCEECIPSARTVYSNRRLDDNQRAGNKVTDYVEHYEELEYSRVVPTWQTLGPGPHRAPLRHDLRALAYPPGSQIPIAIEAGLVGAYREVLDQWEPRGRLEPHEHHCYYDLTSELASALWWWEAKVKCTCGRTSLTQRIPNPPRLINARTGGVVVRYPMSSLVYLDSI